MPPVTVFRILGELADMDKARFRNFNWFIREGARCEPFIAKET